MAFMTVKLMPGVRAEQTPLLLQAGVIQSNNVRWRDGLAEKIGGWAKFFASLLPGPVRELWTWADLDGVDHLAAAGGNNVTVITGGVPQTVTPLGAVRNPTGIATTAGSPLVTITDVASSASIYESVTLQTPVSIGGVVIWPGNYPVVVVADAAHYTINIGQNAATTDSSPTSCTITSTIGSPSFEVNLPHSTGSPPPLLAVGSNFSITLPTSVGGVVLQGFFTVASVVDANNFTVLAPNQATSAQAVSYGNVAAPGIQLIQWVVGTPGPAPTVTATEAFTTDYSGIYVPARPAFVANGQTVLDVTTGMILGTVVAYGPSLRHLTCRTQADPGDTTIEVYNNSYFLGLPGMSLHDDSQDVALGTVVSWIFDIITVSAPLTRPVFSGDALTITSGTQNVLWLTPPGVIVGGLPANSAGANDVLAFSSAPPTPPVLTASAPFVAGYWGILMPPNPGDIAPGMPVTDVTSGVMLGTVASYGPLSVDQSVAFEFVAGQSILDMTPNDNSPGITPGMTIVDTSGGGVLGTVASYVDSVLTLTAPSPVNSASSIAAAQAFTLIYSSIFMSRNPGWVTAGMTVTNRTTLEVLGTVSLYGPFSRRITAGAFWFAGDTTIDVPNALLFGVCAGMTVTDHDMSGRLLGTVASANTNTVTFTAPITFGAGSSADELDFSSGSTPVLTLTGEAGSNSAGASDLLIFSGAPMDVLNFTAPGNHVLVLTAALASNSAGAHDAISFGGGAFAPVSAADWCMFNFGSILLINPQDGPIFQYDPTTGLSNAQLVVNAPSIVHGMFLAMPEQMVVAYGASIDGVQDPMLVAWTDAGDFDVWTLNINNQAGTYRLSRGSKIIGGMQIPMQAMLWTDVGLWLMTYIGYPDVWGFSEIAQECGLIAKKAAGVMGSQVFWMGKDKFWTFTGGQVQPLPCEVWDAVFQNLNLNLVDKIRCGTDTAFDEVWWFYPSLATLITGAIQENDSFVKIDRVTGEWDYGTPVDIYGDGKVGGLLVSDWIDANVFGNPISAMTDPTGTQSQLMSMDMGQDADGVAINWWFRTGLFLLTEGEDFIFVDRCRPDFKWRKFSSPTTPSATVQITLYAQDDSDNPSKPPSVYGPFSVTDTTGAFDPRARGRYFSLKVEGNDLGSFVRLGAVKFRFSPDGRAG